MRFVKTGLLVRPGKASTITVNREQAAEIKLSWGNIGLRSPVERVVVPPCGDDEWLVYSGGIWISESACVGLTVKTADQSKSIRLPVATDCP